MTRRAAPLALALLVIAAASCRREAVAAGGTGRRSGPASTTRTGPACCTPTWTSAGSWTTRPGRRSREGRAALRAYLARLGRNRPTRRPPAHDRAAALINAYNALTVAWILDHYPTPSIRALPDSFTAARHTVGGATVSLDRIEHEALRPEVGYRVHAALVCAARSCPPLAREACPLAASTPSSTRRWPAGSRART